MDQHPIIPDSVVETLARHFLPKIQEFYESQEGQEAFRKWKAQHATENSTEEK